MVPQSHTLAARRLNKLKRPMPDLDVGLSMEAAGAAAGGHGADAHSGSAFGKPGFRGGGHKSTQTTLWREEGEGTMN
eukprot:scaffold97649_cov29-Tisochrysis_lutea.AAC.4